MPPADFHRFFDEASSQRKHGKSRLNVIACMENSIPIRLVSSTGVGRSLQLPAKIKKSSRFLKYQHQVLKSQNPCQDNETFEILSESLRTTSVRLHELLRFATALDYFLMTLGILCALLAGITCAGSFYSTGLFTTFYQRLVLRNVDCVLPNPNYNSMVLAATFAGSVFGYHMIFQLSAKRQCIKMKLAFVESMARKDCSWFQSYIDRDLPFRINRDLKDIQTGIEQFPKLVFAAVAMTLMLVASFSLDEILTLIACAGLSVYVCSCFLKIKVDSMLIDKENQVYQQANEVCKTILDKIFIVKCFCGEAKAVEAYKVALFSPWILWKNVLLAAIMSGVCFFISLVLQIVFQWISLTYFDDIKVVRRKYNDTVACHHLNFMQQPALPRYGFQDIIFCYTTFTLFYGLNSTVFISKLRHAKFVAAEIFFAIDWKSNLDNLSEGGHTPRQNIIGALVFKEVTFSYPWKSEVEILHEISMSVFPGQSACIFGPSKCGKTTVLRLLVRLYNPCEGSILLDGLDLLTLNIPWVRNQLGYVSQEPALLNATIEENICGVGPHQPDELILACKKADILEDILALPEGTNTVVGTNSKVRLTPLQIKKLSLARAFYRQCRVILLDDFFNGMDEDVEVNMSQRFENIRDATLIFTSNKFTPLMKTCDNIIVMKDGRVVQTGNHENISKYSGYYVDLLQETLQEAKHSRDENPKQSSQLMYYKFAKIISDIHGIHDKSNNLNCSRLLENKKAVTSVLLRHVNKKKKLLIPSRFGGGFCQYIPLHVQDEQMYVQNHIMRDRDLRAKLLPYLEGNDKLIKDAGFLSNNQLQSPSPTSAGSAKVQNSAAKESKTTPIKTILHDHKEVITNVTQSAVSANDKETMSHKHSSVKFTMDMRKKRGISKLQHYFGWPINAPFDTESMASEDSATFWNEYSRRLQEKLENQPVGEMAKYVDIIKLAKYSWGYLLVTMFISLFVGFALFFQIFKLVEMMMAYLIENNHLAVVRCREGVLVAALTFFAVFIKEIIVCIGFRKINNDFRVSHFANFLQQNFVWFDQIENDINFLCDYLAADIVRVNKTLVAIITVYTESLVLIVATIYICITTSQTLVDESYTLLIIFPLIVVVNNFEGGFRWMSVKYNPASENIIFDIISNYTEVIAHGRSKERLEKFKSLQFNWSQTVCLKNLSSFAIMLLRSVVYGMSEASFILAYSAWYSINSNRKEYNYEKSKFYITVVYLLMYVYFPMGSVLASVPWIAESAVSAEFIVKTQSFVKEKEKRNKNTAETNVCRWITGFITARSMIPKFRTIDDIVHPPEIRLENVSYVYCTHLPHNIAVMDVNLVIPSKKFFAIVGPHGSSKVLLGGLLLKLYTPDSGKIYLNDICYDYINEFSLRRIISKVSQDPELFLKLTISENIAYGDNYREVPLMEIAEAARIALIDDIVEALPLKYDTILKDLPVKPETFALRQRLAIARAAVHDPKIVIVNQATVSIDDENEERLLQSIMNLSAGRTLIIISQRIHPIRRADKIIVFDAGKIREAGTDQELMDKKGFYYELHMSQRLFERNAEISGTFAPSHSSVQIASSENMAKMTSHFTTKKS